MTDNEQRAKWQRDETRWRWVIGLVITVFLGTLGHLGTGLWWASDINSRVTTVERDQRAQQAEISTLTTNLAADRVQAARQETKLEEALRILHRLERVITGDSGERP